MQIGQTLGFWPTLALVVFTAAVGSSIAAREGTAALAALTQPGSDPISSKLADAGIVLVSGFLLLTPGILTDIVGLLGLFPVTRPFIRKMVLKQFGKRMHVTTFRTNAGGSYQTYTRTSEPTHGASSPTPDGPIISGSPRQTPEHTHREQVD